LILKEGDVGECLHVIFSGSVRVFVYDKRGQEVVLARLEKGQFFGEQALLTATPTRRNANVSAITDVKTVTLSYAGFQKCLSANQKLKELLLSCGEKKFISRLVKGLQTQDTEQRELLEFFGEQRTYSPREVFFRQGDEP